MAERVTGIDLEVQIADTGAKIKLEAMSFEAKCRVVDASTRDAAEERMPWGRVAQAVLDHARWRVVGELTDDDGEAITDARKAKQRACDLMGYQEIVGLGVAALRWLRMLPGNSQDQGEEADPQEPGTE